MLVDTNSRLILDSCPPDSNGDPITCPGIVSNSTTPWMLRQSGGVYAEIDNEVNRQFGSWANVTSGRSSTLGRYWVTFQVILDINLHWIAVIVIDSNQYLEEVSNALCSSILL